MSVQSLVAKVHSSGREDAQRKAVHARVRINLATLKTVILNQNCKVRLLVIVYKFEARYKGMYIWLT